MERMPVKSSQIVSIGHDPKTQTLEIEFKGGGVYRYSNVDSEMHLGIVNSDSIGKIFHSAIRSKPEVHPFTEVETQK